MSATPDSTFSDLEQRIVDLERQLAERDAALAEALEQQTATAEVLRVINSSAGDLALVFDAMLEKAMRLCEADYGHVLTFDGQLFHLAAIRGEAGLVEWRRRLGPVRADSGADASPLARVMRGERVAQVADATQEETYHTHPAYKEIVDISGIRSSAAVALRKEDALLGAIVVYRREVRQFSDKEIALLENFATQAVIAMENARLLGELRQRSGDLEQALEQQTATAEVLGVINSSPGDVAPVFQAMLERATRLCEADFGVLLLFDENGIHVVATRGFPAALIGMLQGSLPVHPGSVPDRLLRGEGVINLPDLTDADPALRTPAFNALVDQGGARSGVAVSLRKDDQALGYFAIYRQQVCPFTEKQTALLQNFAAQAVIAMENARLMTETREALEQQTATAEVLGVINSSPGDLAPVFDAMLEKAIRLCRGDAGVLWTLDGERASLVASYGNSPEIVELLRRQGETGTHPLLRRVVAGEHLFQFDLAEHQAFRSRSVDAAGHVVRAGTRTVIWVALVKDGVAIGAFVIGRLEVRPFSNSEIALLQNFAAQAVIAMENARLITETREALEQQTATAEVLQVINGSPGDLGPVFDAMLEKAIYLCEAAYGVLWTYSSDGFRAATLHGVPQPYAAHLAQEPTQLARGTNTALGLIADGSEFAHFEDVATEEGYMVSGARRLIELGGARTVMVVALRKDGKLLGAISAFRQEVRPFTDKQIALLKNFAAQAVIAMENARLITETREALEQQTATAEVLGVINASPGDLAPVFEVILEKAHSLCGAENGSLFTYDAELFWRVASHRPPPVQFLELVRDGFRPGPGSPLVGVLEGERFVHVADIRQGASERPDDPGLRILLELGFRTFLIVPLRKDGVLLGVITALRREVQPFSDKQIALLENFAAQAVIAMENARLLGELRQRTDEVAELNRGLETRVAEQVEELGRVGRLKRFLAPQLAELIVSHGDERILESHRREIVVVFCDLRGYTAFTETAEPEEVLDFLREYHGALGPLVSQFEGTLDQFSGDGIMVFFNDPVPIPDPAERAVKMAVAMREAAGTLITDWRERGRDLGFGAGIAQGYATLGQIGFAERSGYTAIGTVCNVAARLCSEAKDGQILLSQRVNVTLKGSIVTEQVGALTLKGLTQPVVAFNVQ